MARAGLRKDHYGGALLVVLGIAVVVAGLGYRMGTLREMGSGYFPVVLGVLMALVGLAMLATTPLDSPDAPASDGAATPELSHLSGSPIQVRGWLCIVASVFAFVVLAAHGGLVPASFASVFIGAMGDRKNSVRDAALMALAMTVFGVAVFHYGLHLLLPLFTF